MSSHLGKGSLWGKGADQDDVGHIDKVIQENFW